MNLFLHSVEVDNAFRRGALVSFLLLSFIPFFFPFFLFSFFFFLFFFPFLLLGAWADDGGTINEVTGG